MATLLIFAAIVLYVVAWPVPIDPVAWEAPTDRGWTGVFDRNDLLRKVRAIDLGEHAGPEDSRRRFQVQEKMTAQVANCIWDVLNPKGVGVVIEATHQCMTTRGIHKSNVSMVTSRMLGTFRKDARTRAEFLRMIDATR